MKNSVSTSQMYLEIVEEMLAERAVHHERYGDKVRFWMNRGKHTIEFRVWFDEALLQAHVVVFGMGIFQPHQFDAVADHLQHQPNRPSDFGYKVALGTDGDVVWSTYCQVTSPDDVSRSLFNEVMNVVLERFAHLCESIGEVTSGPDELLN